MTEHSTPPTLPDDPPLTVAGHTFRSRLFLGTGKYANPASMLASLEASGTDCVTVAVRRVNLDGDDPVLSHLDTTRYTLLPNTAGCFTAEDAIRTARLAREAGLSDRIKLEVLGDQRTLLPDPEATLLATRQLVSEGFEVYVYTSDDVILARRLEEAGAAAIMPAGAPIGSGQGILNPANIRTILEMISAPVIVDAGVGTASDVTVAFELGVDGVLLNTGVAQARHPVAMARAMRAAAEAGRLAYLAGRIPRKRFATASSPIEGLISPAVRPGDAPDGTDPGTA
jgi:thiazole synthase